MLEEALFHKLSGLFNPQGSKDRNKLTITPSYTNREVYLNGLVKY